MNRILIVDDEPLLLRALLLSLRARGYAVGLAATGAAALTGVAQQPPDAVILDLGLPDVDGLDLIRALRASGPVPIVVLSGRTGSHDKITALDAGADDYVTKPFTMNELLARLRAVMRRQTLADPSSQVVIGDRLVDLAFSSVRSTADNAAEQKPIRLSPTEWRILNLLLGRPGRLFTGPQILREVWGPDCEDKSNYLRVYLSRLRHKLERDPARPRHLITEPGVGFRFEP